METLYDKASLILNPGIYDTGKVYCTKPLDGSGDLTFTRASNATRVNADGLIEKVRTNLILQSNQFDTNWTNVNTTETSGQAGYDGTNNAWLLSATGASAGIAQTISQGGMLTQSVYAKAGTASWIMLRLTDGTNNNLTYADLTNRVFGNTGANFVRGSITDVGGGWSRISVTINQTAYNSMAIYVALGNANLATTNETIFIQNAQLEQGDIATDYIETTTAAVSVGPVSGLPRLDYSGGCPSLLLEPQRTNLLTYSEQFDNAAWSKSSGITVTANAAISPDGYQNADKLIPPVGTSNSFYIIQAAAGNCMSVFAKAAEKSKMLIYSGVPNSNVWFDLTSGQVTTAYSDVASTSVEDYGGGWFRYSVLWNTTSTNIRIYAADNDNSFSITGNGTDGILIWGAQVEAGSYATSYIPTLGSAVTRLADAAYKTGISSLIGQSEGVIFLDYVASAQNQDGGAFAAITVFGTNVDNIQLYNIGNTLYWYAKNTAGVLIDQAANETLVAGQRYKIAYAYKSGDWALYINGVQKRTYTGSAVPAVSQFNFNADSFGAINAKVENKFNQFLLFKTRLTNAQCQELTAL